MCVCVCGWTRPEHASVTGRRLMTLSDINHGDRPRMRVRGRRVEWHRLPLLSSHKIYPLPVPPISDDVPAIFKITPSFKLSDSWRSVTRLTLKSSRICASFTSACNTSKFNNNMSQVIYRGCCEMKSRTDYNNIKMKNMRRPTADVIV